MPNKCFQQMQDNVGGPQGPSSPFPRGGVSATIGWAGGMNPGQRADARRWYQPRRSRCIPILEWWYFWPQL